MRFATFLKLFPDIFLGGVEIFVEGREVLVYQKRSELLVTRFRLRRSYLFV